MPSQSDSSELLTAYHEQFIKAAKLYNFVNLTTKHIIPHFKFEVRQAMVDAAIPDSLASSQPFSNQFNDCLYSEMNQNRFQSFELPTTEKILVSNMLKILQILHPHIPPEPMHLFAISGFNLKVKYSDNGKVDRRDYDRVVKKLRRALKSFKDKNPTPMPVAPTLIPPASISTPIPNALHGRTIEVPPTTNGEYSQPLSPMTTSQRTSTGDSSTLSSITGQRISQNSRAGTTTTIRSHRQRATNSAVQQSSSSNSTSISDVFGDTIPRQTSAQTQSSRRYNEKEKKTRALGFKIGTTLYDEKLKGNNLVNHLQSEDEIADGINRLLGIEVICGREIKKAVSQNRIGVGPAPKGRPTEIPSEDIEDLAILFFSISSIEQANASKRLKRPQLVSLLDQIVNEKRKREGKRELDATSLYKYHIEPLNSLRQDMHPVDRREFIRVLWLTYKNLSQNYDRWEEACIKEGFGRLAETDEELQEHGRVVFFYGKFSSSFMNFDEMQLSLDQNSERPGGRPADTPTNPSIADPGDGNFKSGSYCTVVASIVGNEPGIPLFIFPTQAKSGNVNVYPKRLESFPQIKAKYGNTFARWYDVNIQFSPKGSMTSSIMGHWTQGFSEYYPDVADEEGKRVMVKSDFGPGRLKNEEFMNNLFVDGFKFFASLPNGTEITQEMDQLFSEFKRLCYLNRDQLFEALIFVQGPKAKLTLEHVGYIVFGGEAKIAPNHVIRFKYKPFLEAFTEEKIKSAREGCGYWPNTRNALKNKKVRHVLKAYEQSVSRGGNNNGTTRMDNDISSSYIDHDDNSSRNSNINEENAEEQSNNDEQALISSLFSPDDRDVDVQEALLQSIEDLNIKTVATLVGKGYSNVAELGTRKLLREPSTNSQQNTNNDINNENEGLFQTSFFVRTEPNTQERQDQLASVKYAGEFHRVTMGGGILNCSDMMIGLARKRMKKDAEELKKQKKSIQMYETIEKEARSSVFTKPYTRWTAKDFKVAIKYKQGLKAPTDRKWNQNAKIPILKAFYEEHYKGKARLGPDDISWKLEDEVKLERMNAGEISSVQETVMYARSLEGRKDYLVKRLLNLSVESRFNIIEDVAILLTGEERNTLGAKLCFITLDGSESESDEIDSNCHTSLVSLASDPSSSLLITEILDEEQSSSQNTNCEEDDVLEISMEEELNSSEESDKNRSMQIDDDSCSEKSSESLFEMLAHGNDINNGGGNDDDSDSSSCFNFGEQQKNASCSKQNEAKARRDKYIDSPISSLQNIKHPVFHATVSDIDNVNDDNNEDVAEEQKEDGATIDEDSPSSPASDKSNGNHDEDSRGDDASICVPWVRMPQITTEKNGVALLRDELSERGISYNDEWKIRKLKSVLTSEGLDGEKEFQPKSSLIMQAIKDQSI